MRPGPPTTSRRRPPRRQPPKPSRHHRHHRHQQHHHHRQRPGPYGIYAYAIFLLFLLLPQGPAGGLAGPPDAPRTNSLQQQVSTTSQASSATASPEESGTLVARLPRKPQNLTIGYLTAAKGGLKDRQGLAISGAITMAIEEINNDPNILPEVNLVLRWNDTKGDTVIGTNAMIDMICEGVAAFFGPESSSCYVEATVAESRNIPMISYRCPDHKASKIRTFARTEPPDTQVTKSVIALLLHYNWNKFSIITEKPWETVALSLQKEARAKNLTINHYRKIEDRHVCCEKRLPCCQGGGWFPIIMETKNRTRIYVFLGTPISLIEFMTSLQDQQLLDSGQYMVIHVDLMTYNTKEAMKYLWKPEDLNHLSNCQDPKDKDFLKRARSLMVVSLTPPTQNYKNFIKQVQEYTQREPFNFPVPESLVPFQKYVTIYAAYLYDSVKLYARTLDHLLRENPDMPTNEIAGNGTLIVDTIIKNRTYQSITGSIIKIDENGDSEGNFSVLALKKEFFTSVVDKIGTDKNFSCDFQMKPVGQFQPQGDNLVYRPSEAIDWPGKNKPDAEPGCGFANEHCPKDDSHVKSVVAAGVLAIILFCATVITISIYRKWKIEQEIEGLLWKIDPSEIHGYPHLDNMMSSPSKLSLVSAISYESKCGGQVFAQTGHYHGVVVRIKELKFSKKKDISRDVMKEMRVLREIRHGNLNSFIGACVEPMRILLITDYCAKGSLYDIIENEDIRLDDMFIASLIHDLIKGMLYIHESTILVCHGNLKSSNCVVTSRWVLQVSDFGLHDMRHCAESDSIGEHQYYRNLLWKAPELLRSPHAPIKGTQEGDVFSFAIILFEVFGRKGPYGGVNLEPKEIVDRVRKYPEDGEPPFRPNIDILSESEADCADYIVSTITDCWNECPELRPDFKTIRSRLKKMKAGKHRNIMDQMMDMMEKYANNLEDLVSERTRLLFEEKQKTEDLLHRMLPKPVANCLTNGIGVEPEAFDLCTIYFSDIVGFTSMSAESSPFQVVNFLNDLYTVFDRIIKGYDVYKVETIGDAYMVVSGLPIKNGNRHAGEIASMALDLLKAVKSHTIAHRPQEILKLRIGIHSGPVVAGVVGLTMPRYCLFGDTVNTASRMESNGEPLRIHISAQCKEALDKIGGYITEERGLVPIKGKGDVKTYWLVEATEKAIQKREVDITDLPPLFCRPRRSPKLNPDSRQPSLLAGLGAGSRRQSSVPRPTDDGSSQCGNSSPGQIVRTLGNRAKPVERSPLWLTDTASKTTLEQIPLMLQQDPGGSVDRARNIKLVLDDLFMPRSHPSSDLAPVLPRGGRKPRVVSAIATSSSRNEHLPHNHPLARHYHLALRESRSLDLIPLETVKRPHQVSSLRAAALESPGKTCRSLESCDKLSDERSTAEADAQNFGCEDDASVKLINNNYPNGNVVMNGSGDVESVETPLLTELSEEGLSGNGSGGKVKKWKSLDQVTVDQEADNGSLPEKKSSARNSIRSYLMNLFNGNGFRSSDVSLRRNVIPGYGVQNPERESIV